MIETFGDYKIDRVLGQGAFAKVFLARKGAELFALKLVKKQSPHETEILRNGLKFHRVLNGCNSELIIRFYEKIENEEHIGIIMEYVHGRELIEYVLENQVKINEVTMGLPMKLVHTIMSQLINGTFA